MDRKTKLTDKQIKKIISDYAITDNQRETARMNNITPTTVKRIITDERNKEELKIVSQKKKENTEDMIQYMDDTFDQIKEVMNLSLKVLKQKLQKPDYFTTVRDVVTVYGILSDKALKVKEFKLKEKENSNDNEGVVIIDDLPK